MGAFDEGGLDVLSPEMFSGAFGSAGGGTPTDFSWTTQPTPGPGSTPSAWGQFGDIAKSLWGNAPTKTAEGSGVLGGIGTFGDIAKAVMPLAQIGLGVGGFLNQQRATDQAEQRGKTLERATSSQLESAAQARPYATEAADTAGRAAAIAPEVRGLTEQFRSGVVDPTAKFAMDRLAAVQRGEIPPAVEAKIQATRAGELQKYRDYLARAGMGDSSSMEQLEALAERNANTARAQWLNEEEKNALAFIDEARMGTGTAGSLYGTEANVYGSSANDLGVAGNILQGSGRNAAGVAASAQQEQQALEQLIAATQRAIGQLSGRQ